MNIVDRQTFVFSINFTTAGPQIVSPINLRFAADELVVKTITYSLGPVADVAEGVQIWCNITNDNLIGAFSNSTRVGLYCDTHFRISNTFQTGNFVLQFQKTDNGAPFYYNSQPLINAPNGNTKGTLLLVIEFLKHEN